MVKKKKIILVVEDDEILLRAMYLKFQGSGYTLSSATDGDTAVKVAQRILPDLILLDLIMPRMDGFEALRLLKADPKTKDIPVIVLSNLGDDNDMQRAKGLGAMDYFVKADTKLEKLQEKINNVLK